jgi:hypothetical protein
MKHMHMNEYVDTVVVVFHDKFHRLTNKSDR